MPLLPHPRPASWHKLKQAQTFTKVGGCATSRNGDSEPKILEAMQNRVPFIHEGEAVLLTRGRAEPTW